MATTLPADHVERLARARLSLEGLSFGDAFCSQFFKGRTYDQHFATRSIPPGPWMYTDDTVMALSVYECLARHGAIDQDELARDFATRYAEDIYRGYGPTSHGILRDIHHGTPWRNVSYAVFGGSGSMGNGGAMRVAPIGGYFADDLGRVAREADASAEVTHAHPEGRAGAIAVAVAAARASQMRGHEVARGDLLRPAIEYTPPGKTRDGLQAALTLSPETEIEDAVLLLGNGSKVTAPDTVPLAVWLAERCAEDLPAGLWAVIEAGGDVDTVGAMVGGVVALHAPRTIPQTWFALREPLALDEGDA
jgi:ADP-ribosylglycohydrolase